MTPFQPLLIAAACALALSACASAPPVSKTSVPPPSATAGLEQSAAAGGSSYGAANTGGTYPYGTNQTADTGATQQAAADASDGIVVMGPDGTVWVQSGVDGARHQDDLDTCYFDAQGQVAFTSYSNRAPWATFLNVAGRRDAGGLRIAALDGRMNDFDSCMVGKGYSPK